MTLWEDRQDFVSFHLSAFWGHSFLIYLRDPDFFLFVESNVIAYKRKRRPVFYIAEHFGFSETFHCVVKRLARTLPFHKFVVEAFHELQRGLVIDGPKRHQNRTSTSTNKGTCYTNHTFSFDLSPTTVTATKDN